MHIYYITKIFYLNFGPVIYLLLVGYKNVSDCYETFDLLYIRPAKICVSSLHENGRKDTKYFSINQVKIKLYHTKLIFKYFFKVGTATLNILLNTIKYNYNIILHTA